MFRGNVKRMKKLIAAKADVDQKGHQGCTPICFAVEKGQIECVKLLVGAKADVDKAEENGFTPIFTAAEQGQTECVKLLLGAKVNVDKAANDGGTPTYIAVQERQTECVKLLLGAKADVEKASNIGFTPILVAAHNGQTEPMKLLLGAKANVDKAAQNGFTPILTAATYGATECMKLLVGAKANVDKSDDTGCTPISVAAEQGLTESVKLLLGAKANVDKAANDGVTPIYVAADQSQTECMKLLLGAKADVDIAEDDGYTPIYVAAVRGQAECVKLLVGAKADVDKAADNGCTPIYIAVQEGQTECVKLLVGAKVDVDKAQDNGCTPIYVAAVRGHAECVKLLVGAKADVDKAADNGCTPIYFAVQEGQTECVKLLVGAKANVDIAKDDGYIPIYIAAGKGRTECVELLIGAKADVDKSDDTGCTPVYVAAEQGRTRCMKLLVGAKADVDKAKDNGSTPMYVTAQEGQTECMKLLVGAKADLDTTSAKDGFTPLHFAVENGNVEILKLLIDAKANVHITNHSNMTPYAYAKTLGQDEICNSLLRALRAEKRAEKEFDTIEAMLMEPGKVGAVIESIAALISEKRSLHGKQHKNKRKKLGAKLTKLTDQMKRFEHVMRRRCSGSDLETWQSFLNQARDSSIAKYKGKRQGQDESTKKQDGAIKQRSENVIGQVKQGNGTDSETMNIVDEASTAEMTKQHNAAKMATFFQSQHIVLQTATNEDGNACSKVIHEARVAAEQNAVIKATFLKQKRVTEEKDLEESRAAALKAAARDSSMANVKSHEQDQAAIEVANTAHISADDKIATNAAEEKRSAKEKHLRERQLAAKTAAEKATQQDRTPVEKALKEGQVAAEKAAEQGRIAEEETLKEEQFAAQRAELQKWLHKCKCPSFVELLVQHSIIRKEDVQQQLAGLPMSELVEKVITGCEEHMPSEAEKWNFAVAVHSLKPDSPMRFTVSEMQAWEEPEVDRWLRMIGIPHALMEIGEELVDAKEGSLRSSLKRIIRQNNLRDDTWEELEKQILKARDEALGWSSSNVKVGKLLWNTDDILGRSRNVVFKGQYNHNLGASKACAVKRIVHSSIPEERTQCLKEIKQLEQLQKCENVIEYYHHEESKEAFFLAMELADGGSLRKRFDSNMIGDWNERKRFCRELCEGLYHLHKMSIVHCDLKPDNLLLVSAPINRQMFQRRSNTRGPHDKHGKHGSTISSTAGTAVKWKLKIADFGYAKTINFSQSHITMTRAGGVGTETWIPPEGFVREHDIQGQAKNNSRTFSYDVHPCGSLLHYILSGGVHAFPGKHIADMERNLRNGKHRPKIVLREGRIDKGRCEDMLEAVHLIGKMLEVEPNRRPTMEVVLEHPFFMTPTDKLNVIRRNRDNSWNWCQGKLFCDSRNPKNDDWRKLKKLKKLLNLKIKQSSYRKQLPELARFIRNVREHLFDGDEGTEKTTTLAKAMGLSLIEHQDSVEADAKVVQYYSDAEPSIFIQLLPWSPLK